MSKRSFDKVERKIPFDEYAASKEVRFIGGAERKIRVDNHGLMSYITWLMLVALCIGVGFLFGINFAIFSIISIVAILLVAIIFNLQTLKGDLQIYARMFYGNKV